LSTFKAREQVKLVPSLKIMGGRQYKWNSSQDSGGCPRRKPSAWTHFRILTKTRKIIF